MIAGISVFGRTRTSSGSSSVMFRQVTSGQLAWLTVKLRVAARSAELQEQLLSNRPRQLPMLLVTRWYACDQVAGAKNVICGSLTDH